MAVGQVVFYQHAIEDLMKRALDLQSMTLVLSVLSSGYTPNAKSHSVFSADASANQITAADFLPRTLANQSVARTSGSFVTFDAADITLSASGVMKAKYVVCFTQAAPQRLVFYFDTETTSTTGVEVTQINIQWNALGIGQINNPQA